MVGTDYREAYDSLPETDRGAILALSVLIDRIGSLPKADREDLFELLQEWRKASDPEEQRSIRHAMEEILAQRPITSHRLRLEGQELARGLKPWAEHVGRRIKELREAAGFSQAQLAEKSKLTQSHISRLENAEHSATNMTLEKIAKALGATVGDLDPCVD